METVFVVEFDHEHGTEVWVASTRILAERIVRIVKTGLYLEHFAFDETEGWTVENAIENWSEFTGNAEFFRITEKPLIRKFVDADAVKA